MADDWYFDYIMKRANVDSYANNVWYAIELANNKKTVYLLENENAVLNLNFNTEADLIEVGYIPKCLFEDKQEIPTVKRRAVVSIYFIDGKFETIEQATNDFNISRQELRFQYFDPTSDLGILKQAMADFAVGIIKGKNRTCIAREAIHKTASLTSEGKLKNIQSVADIVDRQTASSVVSHFQANSNKTTTMQERPIRQS